MARLSRGNWPRMSAWRASATFLAGRKRPLLIIERLMSSMTTVAARVESSVRKTSKSPGASRTGVPGPPRSTAFISVSFRSSRNGSPNS